MTYSRHTHADMTAKRCNSSCRMNRIDDEGLVVLMNEYSSTYLGVARGEGVVARHFYVCAVA